MSISYLYLSELHASYTTSVWIDLEQHQELVFTVAACAIQSDHQAGDEALVRYTDGTGLSQGARTDLHTSFTRDTLTQFFKDRGINRPAHRAMFSRVHRI